MNVNSAESSQSLSINNNAPEARSRSLSTNDRTMTPTSTNSSQAVVGDGMPPLTPVIATTRPRPSDLPQPKPRTIVPTPTPRKNPANDPKSGVIMSQGQDISVSPSKEINNGVQTSPLQGKQGSCTVEVRGSHFATDKDLLKVHFENPNKSNGGPIENIVIDKSHDLAYITFFHEKTAAAVLNRTHTIGGVQLAVSPCRTPVLFGTKEIFHETRVQDSSNIKSGISQDGTDDKDVREKTLDDDPLYISMTGANKQKPNYENVPLAPNPLPSPSKPHIPDVQETVFPMRKVCIPMFQVYLKENMVTQQQKEINVESYIDGPSEMLRIRGTLAGINQAEQILKDFQMNLKCLKKKLKTPCMTQFLQTQVWTQKRAQIEENLRCKIFQESECPPDLLSAAIEDSATFNFDHTYATIDDSVLEHLRNVVHAAGSTPPSKQPQDLKSPTEKNLVQILADFKLKRKSGTPTFNISFKITSDITTEEHCALVNTTNSLLNLKDGRVSSALLEAGGQSIQEECRKKYPNGIKPGDIAVTSGGLLKCKNILHLSLPSEKDTAKIKNVVCEHVQKCLKEANRLKLASIGFPALGTGNLKYPPDLVAEAMYQSTIKYGTKHPKCEITDVTFIVYNKDQAVINAFQAEDRKYKESLRKSNSENFKKQVSSVKQEPKATEIFTYFQEHQDNVYLVVLSISSDQSSEKVIKELMKCYEESVKSMSYPAPKLNSWDDHHITQLKTACADAKLDINLIYNQGVVKLRGLQEVLVRLPVTDMIKEAERCASERQDAETIATQIQWNTVTTGVQTLLKPYDLLLNYKIENAYREREPSVTFSTCNQSYVIDFSTMQEIPEKSGFLQTVSPLRVIRQTVVDDRRFDGIQLPKEWRKMTSSQLLDIVELQQGKEYKKIEKTFQNKEPEMDIFEIKRIQNIPLYKRYMASKKEMESKVPSKQCEQEWLFHEVTEENEQMVLEHGFSRGLCDLSDNQLGDGVYFRTDTNCSKDHQDIKKRFRFHRLLVCRVLVGDKTLGLPGMRLLPEVPTDKGRFYNSAVNDVNNPSVFVVFTDVQAYPDYLIVCKYKVA